MAAFSQRRAAMKWTSQSLNLVLALLANFAGSLAERFTLINEKNQRVGLFGIDRTGDADLTLYDAAGRKIWSTKSRAVPIAR